MASEGETGLRGWLTGWTGSWRGSRLHIDETTGPNKKYTPGGNIYASLGLSTDSPISGFMVVALVFFGAQVVRGVFGSLVVWRGIGGRTDGQTWGSANTVTGGGDRGLNRRFCGNSCPGTPTAPSWDIDYQ